MLSAVEADGAATFTTPIQRDAEKQGWCSNTNTRQMRGPSVGQAISNVNGPPDPAGWFRIRLSVSTRQLFARLPRWNILNVSGPPPSNVSARTRADGAAPSALLHESTRRTKRLLLWQFSHHGRYVLLCRFQ